MTKHQKQALMLAVLSTACFVGVGFSIAAGSRWLALIFLLLSIFIIGFGFMVKGKRRKNGTL
ncbi:DUF5325 family protein [Aneurinibacillus terranovensis]|uniref:DUF5325 family protein n=1 Tax=Aneurinibacillus terranovensis TaxID=278991 RepID=UPI00040D19AA|nr:DUF5325 family protein [Aneurinibacillus terranovensis]